MGDDELANDRTFLAWLRTSLALTGLGFVVAKIALIAQPTNKAVAYQWWYAAAGILIVLCGAAVVVIGYVQHKTVLDLLRTDEAKPRPHWPLTFTVAAVALSFFLTVLIGVST